MEDIHSHTLAARELQFFRFQTPPNRRRVMRWLKRTNQNNYHFSQNTNQDWGGNKHILRQRRRFLNCVHTERDTQCTNEKGNWIQIQGVCVWGWGMRERGVHKGWKHDKISRILEVCYGYMAKEVESVNVTWKKVQI